MQSTIKNFLLLIGVASIAVDQINTAPSQGQISLNKIFKYQGALPIKDDITGLMVKENVTAEEIVLAGDKDIAAAEAACWKLIVEESGR